MSRLEPTAAGLQRLFRDPAGCTIVRQDCRKIIMKCGSGSGRPLFIKLFRQGGLFTALRDTVSRSAGDRELRTCLRLRDRGIPVPEPIGSARDRDRMGLVQQSLYAASWMEATVSLRDLAVDLFRTRPVDRALMKALCGSLGRFVALLHAQGVKAYDLNAGNFLVRREEHGSFQILLVDYEHIGFSRLLSRKRRIGNLAQVSAFLLPLSELSCEEVCAGYGSVAGTDGPDGLAAEVGARARELAALWERKLDDRFRRIEEQRNPR